MIIGRRKGRTDVRAISRHCIHHQHLALQLGFAGENPQSQTAIYRNVGGSSVLLQPEGKMDRRNRREYYAAATVYKTCRAVTHSPINFGGRSIDHNVLFCSLVFLPAAFDSIRGCGESIYLSRCHEPPVMDGGCSLTLTPEKRSRAKNLPATRLLLIFARARLLLTSRTVSRPFLLSTGSA